MPVTDANGSAEVAGACCHLEKLMAASCAGVEPQDLTALDAVSVVRSSAAMERMAGGMRTLALHRVVESGIWRDLGAKSAAAWVADTLGIGLGQAHRILGVAAKVTEQPETADALRKGELSDEQADAVAEASDAEPEKAEEHRQAAKRESLNEMRRRKERARARADKDDAERERRVHRSRTASRGSSLDGAYEARLRTTKEAGARFSAAWDEHLKALQAERKAAGLDPEPYGALAADALIRMAEHATGASGSGFSEGAGSPGSKAGPRAMVHLTCDIAALRRGLALGDETCEIAGVGTVSVNTARGLLGDAIVKMILKDGVDVLNVTHLGRGYTAHQRTAIFERANGECEIPACNTTSGLEIDHAHEVQYGGRSRVEDAELKCWTHHQMKTHQGWRLIGYPGRRRWIHIDQLPGDPAKGYPMALLEHLLPSGGRGDPPDPGGPAPDDGRAPPATPGDDLEGQQMTLLVDA